MKKFSLLLVAALLSALFAQNVFCLEVPPLAGPVMDTAGIMSEKRRAELEEYLLAIDKNSSAQIVVYTVPSLQGEALEDYSLRTARAWQLGGQKDSMGVLLFVAFKEKKIRIETGYGAEGYLTDARCGLIIRNIIAPDFQDGDYSRGIIRGAKAIAASVAPDVETGVVSPGEGNESPAEALALLLFFALYFIMFTGGLAAKYSFFRFLPWAAFFMRNASRSRGSGHYSSFHGSGFGGSSFGGGFGGHGGGFGGGGASGGW